LVYVDASPLHLPAALSFKPNPDGSCLVYSTPDLNFITIVCGAAAPDSISLPPSGKPSLQLQVINLRQRLAAAEEQAFGNVSSVTQPSLPSYVPSYLEPPASVTPPDDHSDDGASIMTDDA
jgi:hypothetical protein